MGPLDRGLQSISWGKTLRSICFKVAVDEVIFLLSFLLPASFDSFFFPFGRAKFCFVPRDHLSNSGPRVEADIGLY